MTRWWTVYGLARELGLSVQSLQRWLDDGVLPEDPAPAGRRPRLYTDEQLRRIRRGIVARRRWYPAGRPR